ncbi:hypothetical protein EJ04DRAFT_527801 [Polyplosphaeria fusca]|uniref:Uncharacterized protein n=1 Tax=Polyplosphaeria fusca TaxID=682080 RepID=A0A9P4QR69_9PLEO|nr:hypothetical protein EJ04DRAFT_527801 [Polyplosphaeria fusca]
MSGPSTRPSPKAYSPVPTQERIDDDVEAPRNSVEDQDDDLYTTSAPLLSARSRGNEVPLRVGESCWYHKMLNWRPFGRKQNSQAYDAPVKGRNWRKIVFWSFLGTLVAAIVALSISTGVLANQLDTERRSSWSKCNRQQWQRHTRVPKNDAWASSSNSLNFPRLYPPLKTPQSYACQAAWNTLRYVPCHEKIWNRSWDNGKQSSIFDPDIGLYNEALCSDQCQYSINRAFSLISSQCTEDDTFDTSDYIGAFTADPGLEDGPLNVIRTIAQRLQHTCRQEPTNPNSYYWSRSAYCPRIMWEDWFIVDGMHAGTLAGLDVFEKRTARPKTEFPRTRSHYISDTCDDIPNSYIYSRAPRREFGPSRNSTTCDWCTMDWFARKLMAWEKGTVEDPETGKAVALKDYLRRVRRAGQRCETEAWERVWARALRRYKQNGDLPEGWDGEDKEPEKPCKEGGEGEGVGRNEHLLEWRNADGDEEVEVEAE